MTLIDEDNRRRAMTDFSSILLVEAAAGTGKTSLIAGRVAMMLADGHPPASITAITFTDLAASQLAQRIRETVEALLAGKVPKFLHPILKTGLIDRQRAALLKAAQHLDELTATTIHGFCQAIIHSHGVQAALDPGARIVDANVADALFFDELSAWLSERLATDANPSDPIVTLAKDIPLAVEELIRELAGLRRKHPDAQPLAPDQGLRPDIAFVEAVRDFVRWQSNAAPDNWAQQIAKELQLLASRYDDVLAGSPDFAALWALRDAHSRLLTKKGLELKSYAEAAEGFRAYRDEGANQDALARYQAVVSAWAELIGHIAGTLVWSLSRSLDSLLAGYQRRKRAAAVLDFDDLLVHVRNLVRDHEDVRRAIGERYKHILVDEFQDTDRIQSEILFSIAAQARTERWEGSRLRPGSLFLVGDPKQAIYRFRGADIEVYGLCRRLVIAQDCGAVIQVTANFRSQSAILQHVNSCFERVFTGASQPEYVALAPTVPDAGYPVPYVTKSTIELRADGRIYADMFREAEAERIADICARLIGNIAILRADGSRSPLRPGDIALLSPGHTELWRNERALEQRGLAVSSQAGQTLMRRQETQDILALLRVLADSSDTLAFGALMRGPLVGLSDQELLDITAALPPDDANRPNYFSVRTDPALINHPLAKAILEDLQYLRRRSRSLTPNLILAEAVERLNARVIMAARHRNRNARAHANLDSLIERARQYGVSGLRTFVRDLQADWKSRRRLPEGRIDAAEQAIEIVTIHSAKGLEWPVVIPINSTTALHRSDQFVHRQSDGSLHWMLGGVASPQLAAARTEESNEEAYQRERIWYVACTRARDLLILPSIPQAPQDSWFGSIDLNQQDVPELNLSSFVPLDTTPKVGAQNKQSTDVFATEKQAVEASSPPIVWRRPSDHDQDKLGDPLDAVVVTEAFAERFEVAGGDRRRGIVLHKLIEEILTGELEMNEGAASERARELLEQLPVAEQDAQAPDALEIAKCALRALALPDIAEIKTILVPEVTVWAKRDDDLLAGRADALAIRNGQVEVAIDWKSDINPTGATRTKYAQQLSDYLNAIGATRGALVFATLGEVIWINSSLR